MRARLAMFKSRLPFELRDIVLSNKPKAMLSASPKGTVPVLVLKNTDETLKIIDESLDIMLWALRMSDPDNLLSQSPNYSEEKLHEMIRIITIFDTEFKTCLEQYKCAKRYHENNLLDYRLACEVYMQRLEERLQQYRFIMSNNESLVDIALLPFIRQFARVERQWYLQSPYPKLRQWLNDYLQSPMFTKVMTKHPLWVENT